MRRKLVDDTTWQYYLEVKAAEANIHNRIAWAKFPEETKILFVQLGRVLEKIRLGLDDLKDICYTCGLPGKFGKHRKMCNKCRRSMRIERESKQVQMKIAS